MRMKRLRTKRISQESFREVILTDKGYRGHNAPPDYKFRVFISGQKRGVTPQIKRQLRRRSAVEPVIGHLTISRYRQAVAFRRTGVVRTASGVITSSIVSLRSIDL
jgi:hypothetical protein